MKDKRRKEVSMKHERPGRKWIRYACLQPCQIISRNRILQSPRTARIINVSRTGALIESDYLFWPADEITLILPEPVAGMEGMSSMSGTVRWEQVDPTSCMGIYSFGLEFEAIIPFRNFFSPAYFDTVYCCA